MTVDPRALRASATFPQEVIAEIQRAADQGVYEIRGFGGKRRLPSFDDLVLLGASWVGLYLARRLTEPIQALAEGTRRVSDGELD